MTENIEDKVLMIIHTKEMMIENKEKTNLMKETLKLLKKILSINFNKKYNKDLWIL